MYKEWTRRKVPLCTIEDMRAYLPNTTPLHTFKAGYTVCVQNRDGSVKYKLATNPAKHVNDIWEENFRPCLLAHEMLALGVFGGKYLNDCMDEFPREWFEAAIENGTVSPLKVDQGLNYFKENSGMSLRDWRGLGWMIPPDPRGWFQWYARYCLGRRIADVDEIQKKRWRAYRRHAKGRSPRALQGLLHWAWVDQNGKCNER